MPQKKSKTIVIRGQMKFFFYQSPSRFPRWVHVVRKTRAKNSHAWAPLRTSKHYTNYLAPSPLRVTWLGKHLLGRNDKKRTVPRKHHPITILHKEYFLQNGIRVKQRNYSTISRCLVLINIVIYRV